MSIQPCLHHCEYPTGHELREAIQGLGLPWHPGSSHKGTPIHYVLKHVWNRMPHKGTPIHYVLKHVWNRMPRRFASCDDGFSRGIPDFHSRFFASFADKKS